MNEELNIPKHWQIKKLGDVAEIRGGKNQSKVFNPNGNYPIYGSSGIFGYSDEYLCDEGTTIIGRKGTINSPIYVKTKLWNVDTAFGLCSKVGLDNKFLYFFCLGFNFLKLDKSTTIPSLAKRDLQAIDIPMAPLLEQQAIVAKIEELLSDLENGKEQLLLAQQQLVVYRQSLLKWAFEGKLTNKDVKDGELPKGWKWKLVSELCNVVRGGSPRPAGDLKYYEGTIPFLKVRDLTKNNNTYLTTYEHSIKEAGLHKTREIKPNTLLLSNSGATLGVPKICMINATMNDGIAAFLDLDLRSNLYLYYYWLSKTKELRNINMGAAQPNLNTDIIKNYLVPYCSFEEQQLIVDELESKLTVCDKIEETIATNLLQAETLRQSILKKAFEGRLV
jgi:type I restriction enzyme S subunit